MSRGDGGVVLRRDVHVAVQFGDRTPFGSAVGDRADQATRELFAPVLDLVRRRGPVALATDAASAAQAVLASDGFRRIASADGGSHRLSPEVLYPEPAAAPPVALTFRSSRRSGPVVVPVGEEEWRSVRALLGALCGDGAHPDDWADGAAGSCLAALGRAALAGPSASIPARARPCRPPAPVVDSPVVFVGHNTVLVRGSAGSVLVDPLLFPRSAENPERYQPLDVDDLGPIGMVAVTHSHPDHFDPGSLLRLPRETPIVVPEVERESLLAVDMAARLRQLGFVDVRPLRWGASIRSGDVEVHALPFYGEQPTDGLFAHNDAVHNDGNAYVVTTDEVSVALLADAGRDHRGDLRQVAEEWSAGNGAVDVVFAGYRGWSTYPAQLLVSSVARYALFVPSSQWRIRQQLMNDVAGAVDVAERFGARVIVPYADGGAPWHWRVGLGPCLDGTGVEDVDFDPFPERVLHETRARVRGPGGAVVSPVEAVVMRPGEGLRPRGGAVEVVRHPEHAWPYATALLEGAVAS